MINSVTTSTRGNQDPNEASKCKYSLQQCDENGLLLQKMVSADTFETQTEARKAIDSITDELFRQTTESLHDKIINIREQIREQAYNLQHGHKLMPIIKDLTAVIRMIHD